MTVRAGILAAALSAILSLPAQAQGSDVPFNAGVGAQSETSAGAAPVAGVPSLRPVPAAGASAVAGYGNPTLRQMIGQMVMVGFMGKTANGSGVRRVADMIRSGDVGGVIYLGHNVSSLAQVAQINQAFLAANPTLPPLIAIDQEGGQIERLTQRHNFREIQSAAAIAQGSVEGARKIYGSLAADLSRYGFNLNLGPVVDVNVNPRNPIIARYKRSYSARPETVAAFAGAFVDGHRANNVLTALKHYPGHGSSKGDSHLGFTNITNTWQDYELDPYRSLISAGKVDLVMSGHLYHSGLNAGGEPRTPASLSAPAMARLRQMGPNAANVVVITDDMQMGAIRKEFGFEDALYRAVMAGNDIVMYTALGENWAAKPAQVIATLEARAATDAALQNRIVESYGRIMRLKAARLGRTTSLAELDPIHHGIIDFPDQFVLPADWPWLRNPVRTAGLAPGAIAQPVAQDPGPPSQPAVQAVVPQAPPVNVPAVEALPPVAGVPRPQPPAVNALEQIIDMGTETRFAEVEAPVEDMLELNMQFETPPGPERSLMSYDGIKSAVGEWLVALQRQQARIVPAN